MNEDIVEARVVGIRPIYFTGIIWRIYHNILSEDLYLTKEDLLRFSTILP